MTIAAVKGEESGRTKIRAQQIDVGDASGDDYSNRSGAREPGKSRAFKDIRSQAMSEWIHDRVISQRVMCRQLAVWYGHDSSREARPLDNRTD